jgi:hypothetical protein
MQIVKHNTLKTLIYFLAIPFLSSCGGSEANSQNTTQSTYDIVTFLDGKTINKDKFVNSCVEAIIKEGENNIYKNNGRDFCSCFIERISDNFTLTKFNALTGTSSNEIDIAVSLWKDDKIQSIAGECFANEDFNNTEKFKITSEKELEALTNLIEGNYINSLTSEEHRFFLNTVDKEAFFRCLTKKLISELSVKELFELDVTNTKVVEKIQAIEESCLMSNLKQ